MEKRQNRVLIITAYYPPCSLIGGQRPYKLSKHLIENGWDVTVITLQEDYTGPTDSALPPPVGIRVLRTKGIFVRHWLRRIAQKTPASITTSPISSPATASLLLRILNNARSLFHKFLNYCLRPFEFPDEWIGWKIYAKRIVPDERFDVVIATIPPFSAATIAREIAARHDTKLVIDYRDPWSDMFTKNIWANDSRTVNKHITEEQRCIEAADMITTVSPTIANWIRSRAPLTPIHVIPQGANLPITRASVITHPVTLIYAGSLAYGRSLGLLLHAMKDLQHEYTPNELTLIYCGPHGEHMKSQLSHYGVERYAQILGNIKPSHVEAMLRGGIGVVIISPGYEYAYPGKLFELISAGCPILCIGSKSSAAARLVLEHNLGWCIEDADFSGATSVLRNLIDNDIPKPRNLEKLSTNTLMSEYERALSNLVRAHS